jgi:hypothetical protein
MHAKSRSLCGVTAIFAVSQMRSTTSCRFGSHRGRFAVINVDGFFLNIWFDCDLRPSRLDLLALAWPLLLVFRQP